jgi:hypothetical protein
VKTPHRRSQRCTLPTSLPRSKFCFGIVQDGVHAQLWQSFSEKGTVENLDR